MQATTCLLQNEVQAQWMYSQRMVSSETVYNKQLSRQFSKTVLNHCLNKKLHYHKSKLAYYDIIKLVKDRYGDKTYFNKHFSKVNIKEFFMISQSKILYNKYLLYTFHLPSNKLKDLITSTKSAYCFSVNFIGCRSDALHSKTQFITRLSLVVIISLGIALTIRVWETLGSPFKLFNSQMSKESSFLRTGVF
ncbi:hypothetical protein T01_8860 [Trichinella spiralis]|uniref:Uncharacterized protein n=1 Tax=Trichinella spiralis TaxID=6334 RepID=A0A0V1AQJ7_TRISP|nr:hypothetical protein T01_15584 [Trichinella spiralis]KRY34936.1 hypothetical protein T01_8860 [Trichinella spiralis]